MTRGLPAVKRLVYHDEMVVSKKRDLRARQKERTRRVLVDTARRLLHGGTAPTVAGTAQAAGISRATAYRYFPTQDSLLLEAGRITPAAEPVDALLEALPGDDPEADLLAVQDCFYRIVLSQELAMRTALRTYLDTWISARGSGAQAPPVREGRRMRWLDKVLAPARRELTAAQFRRLRAALALTLGTDALVVMKDVCRMGSDKEALEVLRWSAKALLHTGLAEAGARKRKPGKPRGG